MKKIEKKGLENHNPIQQILSTLKLRLHRLFSTTPSGWLYDLVSFYRSYEPKWLAKHTCSSYAFQLKLDEVVNAYLKETKTKVHQVTWHNPGLTTNGTYIIKKNGWSEEKDNKGRTEQQIWKQGFENAVYDIWGYSIIQTRGNKMLSIGVSGITWVGSIITAIVLQKSFLETI